MLKLNVQGSLHDYAWGSLTVFEVDVATLGFRDVTLCSPNVAFTETQVREFHALRTQATSAAAKSAERTCVQCEAPAAMRCSKCRAAW